MIQVILQLLNKRAAPLFPFLGNSLAAKRIGIVRNSALQFRPPIGVEFIRAVLSDLHLGIDEHGNENKQDKDDDGKSFLLPHLQRFVLNQG